MLLAGTALALAVLISLAAGVRSATRPGGLGKPFDWLDLEPTLGFVLALVYLAIGVKLLRTR